MPRNRARVLLTLGRPASFGNRSADNEDQPSHQERSRRHADVMPVVMPFLYPHHRGFVGKTPRFDDRPALIEERRRHPHPQHRVVRRQPDGSGGRGKKKTLPSSGWGYPAGSSLACRSAAARAEQCDLGAALEDAQQEAGRVRAVIDKLYDGGADQKIELFARTVVPGWSNWGNEVCGPQAAATPHDGNHGASVTAHP
jgi:hypothetical protein